MTDKTIVESDFYKKAAPDKKTKIQKTAATIVEGMEEEINYQPGPSTGTVVEGDTLSSGSHQTADYTAFDQSKQTHHGPMIGKVLDGKFKIIREIGDGGMGIVYEAEHIDLNKRFAIKSIRSEFSLNEEFNQRFDLEAKTQASLSHPNIISVSNYFREDDRLYLIMEYVQGRGLDELIEEKAFTEDNALAIIKDVLKALEHAHSRGVVHRDIKPSNIMVKEDNTALLMDFGIATLIDSSLQDDVIAGTAPYMSPEQINSPGTLDHRADIYSLGIVLYEMLIGERPFDGKSDSETRMNQIHKKLPDIEPLLTDSFTGMSDIIVKALGKHPENRFEDCTSFIAALDEYHKKTHIECRNCKQINRVKNKYRLKGEKCSSCGKVLSMGSKFTKIWAAAFIICIATILVYMLYPWPGKLIVKTTPENATISINGEEKGVSPFTTKLDPGEYEILIKKDEKYETVKKTVTIEKHAPHELVIRLPQKNEMHRKAFDTYQQAYLTAFNICNNLRELEASQVNLDIAKKIGDSAIIEGYEKQIADIKENIDDFQKSYLNSFTELKAINPEIRKQAYEKYAESLEKKQGNIKNLSKVWNHFQLFLSGKLKTEEMYQELKDFC